MPCTLLRCPAAGRNGHDGCIILPSKQLTAAIVFSRLPPWPLLLLMLLPAAPGCCNVQGATRLWLYGPSNDVQIGVSRVYMGRDLKTQALKVSLKQENTKTTTQTHRERYHHWQTCAGC